MGHQLAGGFGERAGQRRVDREGVGELVDGQRVLHRHRDRKDQLAGPRRDDDPAEPGADPATGEELDEPVAQPAHLGPGVRGEGQRDDVGRHPPELDLLLGDADRRDLGVGEDVRGHRHEPQRRHGLPQRVPHGDAALHRGDRRQRQDACAVTRRVHPGQRRARDLVHLDVTRRA